MAMVKVDIKVRFKVRAAQSEGHREMRIHFFCETTHLIRSYA